MLIDLFNAFDPVRFLIDAPLWVSFVAPGITYTITLSVVYGLFRGVLGSSGAAEGLTLALGVLSTIGETIWMLSTLPEVFLRAGVMDGYPLVLAVAVGTISNVVTALIAARAVFSLGGFLLPSRQVQEVVDGSHESK